eukprot:g12591.t1
MTTSAAAGTLGLSDQRGHQLTPRPTRGLRGGSTHFPGHWSGGGRLVVPRLQPKFPAAAARTANRNYCMDLPLPSAFALPTPVKRVSPDGKCGPQHGNLVCPVGCCSSFGWCGVGHDWCDCGICNDAFGRCSMQYQFHRIGEHMCKLPDQLEHAIGELFQKRGNAGSTSSDQSDGEATKIDQFLQHELEAIHRSMPLSSYEQLYHGFVCLLEHAGRGLTLRLLERTFAAVSKKATLQEVVHGTILLRDYSDVQASAAGGGSGLEYVWIWLLSLRDALSGRQAESVLALAEFLAAIRGHLLVADARVGGSSRDPDRETVEASVGGNEQISLKTVIAAMTKLARAFPNESLAEIDRGYTELRLTWETVDFFSYAEALTKLASLSYGNNFPGGHLSAGLEPIALATYIDLLHRLKASLHERLVDELPVLVDNLTALLRTFPGGNGMAPATSRSRVSRGFDALAQLMAKFGLSRSGSVAELKDNMVQVFGSRDNDFPAIADLLVKVRDWFQERTNLPQALALVSDFLHTGRTQERANLDVVFTDMKAYYAPGSGESKLPTLPVVPISSHEEINDNEAPEEPLGGAASDERIRRESDLGTFFVASGATTPPAADAIVAGIATLQTAYSSSQTPLTAAEAKSSLLRLGRRWRSLDFDATISSLEKLAKSHDGILSSTHAFKLATVVGSLEVLSKFAASSDADVNDPNSILPFPTCVAALAEMEKVLLSDQELFDVAVDFASLKISLVAVEDAGGMDAVGNILDVWTTFVEVKTDLGGEDSTWKEIADQVHSLLSKFRHVAHLHHLKGLLGALRTTYRCRSLREIVRALLVFETAYPDFRDSLEELVVFLVGLPRYVDGQGAYGGWWSSSSSAPRGAAAVSLLDTVHALVELKGYAGRFATGEEFFASLQECVSTLEPVFASDGSSVITFPQLATSFSNFHTDFLRASQDVTLHDLTIGLAKIHKLYPLSSLQETLVAVGRLPEWYPELTMHQLIEEVVELRTGDISALVETLTSWKKHDRDLSWHAARERYVAEHGSVVTGTLCSWLLISVGVLLLVCIGQDLRKQYPVLQSPGGAVYTSDSGNNSNSKAKGRFHRYGSLFGLTPGRSSENTGTEKRRGNIGGRGNDRGGGVDFGFAGARDLEQPASKSSTTSYRPKSKDETQTKAFELDDLLS